LVIVTGERVSYLALGLNIRRFVSSGEVQRYLENTFRERPAVPPAREDYHGAAFYRYKSALGAVICQEGPFVVEMNPRSERGGTLVMKVLDIVLA
jgi:hypothetical protein